MTERFPLRVPEADLADLRDRLHRTRWPEAATDPRQGVALERVQRLCTTWADGYDWRQCEGRLAELGSFRTRIDGLGIHYLHVRSALPDAFPLVLTHGWPGSIVEYLGVLEPLTAAGFHCVVPSLPGYGWSEHPTRSGWGVSRVARAWAELMARLGYQRYGAQGSDWGTSVCAALGQEDPEHVAGVLLMPPLVPGLAAPAPVAADDASGYSEQQRTRPQTIGYALTDSPAGLAAWIVEKLDDWTDPRRRLPDDAVLDNLMHYWLPRTGASAARLYWESLADVGRWLRGPLEERDLVHVPAGGVVFPYELQRPDRAAAERRFTDLRYWSEPERGGHFPAWEEPERFVAELTAFFALLR